MGISLGADIEGGHMPVPNPLPQGPDILNPVLLPLREDLARFRYDFRPCALRFRWSGGRLTLAGGAGQKDAEEHKDE